MKRIRRQAFALLLALAAVFSGLGVPAAQGLDMSKMGMIRIGIAYDSSAMVAVNALADYGYSVGYYNADNYFTTVFTTTERFVTFAKDTNLWISGNTVRDSSGSGTFIGAYHTEAAQSFPDIASAQSFADSMKSAGLKAFPAYINGAYRVRAGMYSTLNEAQTAAANLGSTGGVSWQGAGDGSKRAITMVNMNTFEILFEFESTEFWPAALPRQGLGEKALIKNGVTWYYGAFEFKRISGGNINFINMMTMQDYLKGVLPYEMNNKWPLEALKAQAVVARSYAVTNYGKHSKSGFNLCNSDDCQVYRGSTLESDLVVRAVDETNGMVATYDGQPIQGFFYSSNGGASESNYYAWGGTQLPYLVSVQDPYENLSAAQNGTWSKPATKAELTAYLQGKNYSIGNVVDCYVSEYSPGGNVYKLTFVDDTGKTLTITRTDNVRIAMNGYVKSPRFKVNIVADLYINTGSQKLSTPLNQLYVMGAEGVRQVSLSTSTAKILSASGTGSPSGDSFSFDGSGWGHNVGMSQYGARGMAEQGFSFTDIITFYFQGTQITAVEALRN